MTLRRTHVALAALLALSFPALAEDGKDGKEPAGSKNEKPGAKEEKPGAKPDGADGKRESKEDREKLSTEQFSSFDRSGDGVLRGAEVPEGWAARFDRDGDGNVSRSEFVEINSRPEKLRRLHPMRDARARAADSTRTFDRNKDGVVQRDEYPGDEDVFRRADRNRNGSLDAAEMLALAEDEIEGIRKTMRNPSRYEFLVIFDVDKNNNVDADEYDGPVAAFRKYDSDNDGKVTYYELFPERMMRDSKEPVAAPKPEKQSIVQTLDKDGDGKVARAEFPGNDTAWRRLDANGDGFVTSADSR